MLSTYLFGFSFEMGTSCKFNLLNYENSNQSNATHPSRKENCRRRPESGIIPHAGGGMAVPIRNGGEGGEKPCRQGSGGGGSGEEGRKGRTRRCRVGAHSVCRRRGGRRGGLSCHRLGGGGSGNGEGEGGGGVGGGVVH